MVMTLKCRQANIPGAYLQYLTPYGVLIFAIAHQGTSSVADLTDSTDTKGPLHCTGAEYV